MKTFLATILLVALCVALMCAGILFRKDGKFPQTDVGSNEEMRKRGIRCMKDDEDVIGRKNPALKKNAGCSGEYSSACETCGFYRFEKDILKK